MLQSHSAAAASSRFPLRTQAEQLPGSGETAAAIPIPSGSMRASLIQALDYLRGLESRVPHFPYLILFSDPGVFISNSIPLLKVVSLAPFPPKKKSLKKKLDPVAITAWRASGPLPARGRGGTRKAGVGEGRAQLAPHPTLPLRTAGVALAGPERSLSLGSTPLPRRVETGRWARR